MNLKKSLWECKNDLINVDKIRKERVNLLKEIYNYLGIQNFLRATKILGNCVYSYYLDKEKIKECNNYDIHHCAGCWGKDSKRIGYINLVRNLKRLCT